MTSANVPALVIEYVDIDTLRPDPGFRRRAR